MTNAIRRISMLLVIFMLATFCLASCAGLPSTGNDNNTDTPTDNTNQDQTKPEDDKEQTPPTPVIYTFELKTTKTNVVRGESVTLTPVLKSADGEETVEDVEYIFVMGAEYATISGNTLTVSNTAPHNTVIQVKARSGASDSSVVTLIVNVDIVVESLVIEAIGSSEVVKNSTVGLIATVDPAIAASLVEWTITEGADIASIRGTTLIIGENAQVGDTIKVKATAGTVESNELVFTVCASQYEQDAAKYFISTSTNSIRLDKKGTSSPVLSAEVYDFNFEKATGVDLQFTIVEGSQYLGISQSGDTCTFEALGHGHAEIEVRVAGTNVTSTVMVEVIVPPEAINLPEVFAERPLFEYSFSKVDPITGAAESLAFVPTIKGETLACTDLVYTFVGAGGAVGDSVAVYENGVITFNTTGKVLLTVSSASGSRVEATASYTFNINEGYNVSTFEELSYVMESGFYTGSLPINVVVLEKPVGQTDYEYGYDLVPSVILEPQSEHTIKKIVSGGGYTNINGVDINMRLQAVNKGLWINGNSHKIDVSQLRVFTYDEYVEYANENGVTKLTPNWSSLLSVEPWVSGGPTANDPNVNNKVYYVKLYDIEVKGNVSVDYDPNNYDTTGKGEFVGAFREGISIGSDLRYQVHYYIDSDNLTVSGFMNGFDISSVVGNGTISNLHAYNCYSTGILIKSSILTLENIKLGMCGATGIELSPSGSSTAGLNNNENSKITIAGYVDASTNLNNGNTTYFSNYSVAGMATIPQIINGNAAMYHDNQVSHVRNANGEFIFVSLLFNDLTTLSPNTSEVEYAAYQAGGIIDMTQLPADGSVNTTHQFIKMTIWVEIPGLGTQAVGTAYFYNHNYAG